MRTVLAFALVAAVLPARAQDVAGTWEMTEVQDAPVDDHVVFTRMTFTDDRILTTAIFLDPDDGELSARVTRDRYRRSNGQLVVEAVGSTTVFDVEREVDRLTVRDLETGIVLVLRPSSLDEETDPALVSDWHGTGGGHTWRIQFGADGRALVARDGDEATVEPYVVAGPYLLLDEDVYRFNVSSGRLTLEREDETLELFRPAASSEAPDRSGLR